MRGLSAWVRAGDDEQPSRPPEFHRDVLARGVLHVRTRRELGDLPRDPRLPIDRVSRGVRRARVGAAM
jgi:hypothetical protein